MDTNGIKRYQAYHSLVGWNQLRSPKVCRFSTLHTSTASFNAVCCKARTLHGLSATRYGYIVSYWRSRISVSFTRSLARRAVNTKMQIYRGSPANNLLEPVELARAF